MFRSTASRRAAEAAAGHVQAAGADLEAVTDLVRALQQATTPQAAVETALETIRSRFGWAYGSYWRLERRPGTEPVPHPSSSSRRTAVGWTARRGRTSAA